MAFSLRNKAFLKIASRSAVTRCRDRMVSSFKISGGASCSCRAFFQSSAKNSLSSRAYSVAIARDLPNSFALALTKYSANEEPISVDVAQRQHEIYLEKLRGMIPTYCLPALEVHPDSVFVEDTVVAVGQTAVITNPGHPSRQGEVDTIKDTLERYGMEVLDMRDPRLNQQYLTVPLCDGGDVLCTSRHLFVGLSERTNLEAYHVLKKVFKTIETIPVPLDKIPNFPALHLKSLITHMDAFTLIAPEGPEADQLLELMTVNQLGYDVVRVLNPLAANLVSVNGRLLAQDGGCSKSREILMKAAQTRGHKIEFVDCSEIAKVDGALTCCSVLLM